MKGRLLFSACAAGIASACVQQAPSTLPPPPAAASVTAANADAFVIDYFQPLMGWLAGQNKYRQCGWE
jgi:hypothetical protein